MLVGSTSPLFSTGADISKPRTAAVVTRTGVEDVVDSFVVEEDRGVVAAVVVVVVEVVTHSGLCTSPSNLTADITHQNSFGSSETSVR